MAATLFADAAASFTAEAMAGAANPLLKVGAQLGAGATCEGLYAPDVQSGHHRNTREG
eukprot:CAMPEP_0174699904 /NCGR_PEP_ID=MMETSP1094-20130205/5037_1 /TAXON_ID=156173 /ORGANISM="Chrysochromulina brevifilum, Strain UTEX LB 985" /LENGTH=57 /DNA_ID=CAMNT_0015897317 /DNA_START=291 /DNA_END=465 /DNA_ORIENTATION=+